MTNADLTYLKSLLSGNRNEASKTSIDFINANKDIKKLYQEVMKPALYEVGNLWEKNKISVADEHMATAITEGILNELYDKVIPEKYNGKKIVLACTENEEHQVGIKMISDIFEMQGWETFFLGAGIPTIELKSFIRRNNPDLLAISLTVFYNFKSLLKMIEEIRNDFPSLKIIVGGQAFNHGTHQALEKMNDVTFLNDMKSIENFIKNQNN